MIANYILGGRLQAILATAASSLLSLLMPPFAYLISGTVVALITLRKGIQFGLQTLTASLVIFLLFIYMTGIPYELGIAYALGIWLPVCGTAAVLRYTESQGLALLFAGLIAIMLVISMYIFIDDVAGWWQSWFDVMLEKSVPAEELPIYREALATASVLFNAIMAVGLMLNVFMSIMLARWWQSRLFNKGGFRPEFFRLALPSMILPVSGLFVVLAMMLTPPWQGMLRDVLFVMLFMYLIQGVVAVHRNVDKYSMSGSWLLAMYCFLLLVPQLGILIACLGMTDIYVNWRRKKSESGMDL